MSFTPGDRATDDCTGDEVIVVAVNEDERIDEKTARYDYNKNPISVYELEQENGNDWPPDDPVVTVVYPNIVEDRLGSADVSVEDEIIPAIEQRRLKPYYFPLSRLK